MQLTLHATCRTPHGASRLVLTMSAWSVKTPRAPFRHCRDVRVYGHRLRPCMTICTPPLPPRSMQVMCAWSVKTRRAPSRHCRDASVYGHTTTAMHDMSTTPSKNFQRSIDQKPATHKDGWFATATRIFQRAEDIVAVMCQVCNSPKTL